MAKEFEPQLRKLAENIPELQRPVMEGADAEHFRQQTLAQEEASARQSGIPRCHSPPFSFPLFFVFPFFFFKKKKI